MKQVCNQINPIAPRANSKLVQSGTRKFLIGGMTADKVTNDIYQLRIVEQDNNLKIQWKLLKFKNNVFKPRNSFSACGGNGKLYIWGGLQSKQEQQICLSDLIQVDIQKYQMRLLLLRQPIKIHSATMHFDTQDNTLVAIGGTNQFSTMGSFYYVLKLNIGEEKVYQWNKSHLDCQQHKGFLWQHTSNLSKCSYFTGQQGKFLTVIGGCHYPQSPYNSIIQFNLIQKKVTNFTTINYGLVSHDSCANKEQIAIYGGANGGDFNSNRITLTKGKLTYDKGHNAVGCVCCEDSKGYYVIGGVSGPESLNNVVIYMKNI